MKKIIIFMLCILMVSFVSAEVYDDFADGDGQWNGNSINRSLWIGESYGSDARTYESASNYLWIDTNRGRGSLTDRTDLQYSRCTAPGYGILSSYNWVAMKKSVISGRLDGKVRLLSSNGVPYYFNIYVTDGINQELLYQQTPGSGTYYDWNYTFNKTGDMWNWTFSYNGVLQDSGSLNVSEYNSYHPKIAVQAYYQNYVGAYITNAEVYEYDCVPSFTCVDYGYDEQCVSPTERAYCVNATDSVCGKEWSGVLAGEWSDWYGHRDWCYDGDSNWICQDPPANPNCGVYTINCTNERYREYYDDSMRTPDEICARLGKPAGCVITTTSNTNIGWCPTPGYRTLGYDNRDGYGYNALTLLGYQTCEYEEGEAVSPSEPPVIPTVEPSGSWKDQWREDTFGDEEGPAPEDDGDTVPETTTTSFLDNVISLLGVDRTETVKTEGAESYLSIDGISKRECNIKVIPSFIEMNDENKVFKISVTNYEAEPYSPDVGITGNSSVVDRLAFGVYPGTVLADTTNKMEVFYSGSIFIDDLIEGEANIFLRSRTCNDVLIPVKMSVNNKGILSDFLGDTFFLFLPITYVYPLVKIWMLMLLVGVIFAYVFIVVKRVVPQNATQLRNNVTKVILWTFLTFLVPMIITILIRSILGS